jgi:sortase (surface protein transpeptidase)
MRAVANLRQRCMVRFIDNHCDSVLFSDNVLNLFEEEEMVDIINQSEDYRAMLKEVNEAALSKKKRISEDEIYEYYYILMSHYLADITIPKLDSKIKTMSEDTEEKREFEELLQALKIKLETKEELEEVKSKMQILLAKNSRR